MAAYWSDVDGGALLVYQKTGVTARAQIVSQGNGDGVRGRKGKSQGSRSGNIHGGGRAVCQEENAGTRLPSMFVLEWGSDIQTEHCLFARTHVKGLFVPS